MSHVRHTPLKLLGLVMLAGSLAVPGAAFADAEPQGLYSADQLLDAGVYSTKSNQHIGEVEDIILGNRMQIQAFVIETGDFLGLGGKAYVVSPKQVRVRTEPGEEATEPDYTVLIDFTADQLKRQPVYSNSWWNKAQNKAARAWDHAREGAHSAWTTIKQSSKSLYESAVDVVHSAAESVSNATNN